jgi:hypothetical protein
MQTMTSQWGRIDADGTVYVHTDAGDRPVGSWQAGDAAAGLAYYERRYEDLATEVNLLEQRLASGAADPAATRSQAIELTHQLPTASVIGDLAALQVRLTALLSAAEKALEVKAAAREQARADAIAAKEALVLEAEKIAETASSWKASGERLRGIVEEWKHIKGIDRRTDDALWKRFAAARDAFAKRRGQHFAQLDAERSASKAAKEDLVRRAEELAQSADGKETAAAMRELMAQWKAAPRGSREAENALWSRFRAAQDAYFARRSRVFNERDSEQVANLARKNELITAAEQLDLADPRAAQTALRELQARFDEVGHVPRDAMRRTDERMRLAGQRVRDAVDAEWRRSTVESSPFLAALRERLSEAEEKLRRAHAHGDAARIARAEAEVAERRSLIPD